MILADLELHPVRIPMRIRFRGVEHRDSVLIRGPEGWGEFSPFAEYPPEVAVRWLEAALELATSELPQAVRAEVPVNVTIPAVEPEMASDLVVASGADTAKVKIGGAGDTVESELERVAAVREALGPGGHIRVDVNAGWNVETAARRIRSLSDFGLQYVEQPVATIDEMLELKGLVDVPLAADELVRQADDPLAVVERGAADVFVVKVQPMGGVRAVVDLAKKVDLPVVVSSAVENSVGMYGGLAAAAAIPHLELACGLGTVSLLAGDVVDDPLIAHDGTIEVRRPEPSPELLRKWRPDPETTDALLRRLSEAAELLQ